VSFAETPADAELGCCNIVTAMILTRDSQQASEDAVRRAQIGRALPGAIHNQQLVLKKKRLRNEGTDTAGSEQAGQGSDEVDEKDDQMTH